MTASLAEKIAQFCQKNDLLGQKDKIVIGVSGGPDSLCLFHLLQNLSSALKLTLTIAHLNHQLRANQSQADEEFVREIAARWQLPIFVETCPVAHLAAQRHQSIEEAARQARYAFLWRVAERVGANKIAVGHNADDQVETVLMHFLRGAGLPGLRGMLPAMDISGLRLPGGDIPDKPSLPAPVLIRPLLETTRGEVEAYCHAHNLLPRRDLSNQDTTFFRNRLRHELIPLLEAYNPNIRAVLQRTAKVVAAEVEFLQAHVEEAWQHIIKSGSLDPVETGKIEIDLANWLALPLALKRATLRRAVQILRRGLRNINFEHIETALVIVEAGQTGAKATLPQGLMLTVGAHSFTVADTNRPSSLFFDQPYLARNEVFPLQIPGVTRLTLSNWQLKAELLVGEKINFQRIHQSGPWEAYLDADVVSRQPVLRPRRPGDIFCPLGLGGSHQKLNEFMINEKIPADRRDYIPLLVANNQILWVCGYRPDERARVQAATPRVLYLKFEPV